MRVISQRKKGINMYNFPYETTGFGVKKSPDGDTFRIIACFGMGYDYVIAEYDSYEEAERALISLQNTANTGSYKEFRFPATA